MENNNISTPILIEDLGMIFYSETSKQKRRYGLYRCECGVEFKTRTDNIKNGHTNSCGCYKKKVASKLKMTHGLTYHPIYTTWHGMIQRCNNKKHSYYKDYGDRGIKVCDRWMIFENFVEDMLSSYKYGLSIDRIDVNGNYSKSNCRWATNYVQCRNTRLLRSTNTSGYRGVSFSKIANKWLSQIVVNNKSIYLGRHSSALEAAKSYDKYVIDNNLEHPVNGVLFA